MPPPLRAARPFGLLYRLIADADLAFLGELYASTRWDEVAALPWTDEAKTAFLAQQFDAQHRHYMAHYPDAEWLVVERGGAAIGRLYLEEWPTQIRIIDIALMPDSRGQGIGAAILLDTIALARGLGKRVSIHVEKNNVAMRLYRRLGFAAVEDKGVYDLMECHPDQADQA